MAKLVKAVHVKDPDRHRMVLLLPGEEPEPRLAALVTNPDAWEGGRLPNVEATDTDTDGGDGDGKAEGGETSAAAAPEPEPEAKKAAPAAKKTAARKTAASKPARGREAADQGDSGE